MESFIRSDQFNYIEEQIKHLLHSHATVNDAGVLDALRSVTKEKVLERFGSLTEYQEELIVKIIDVQDQADATLYLSRLRQYVHPFPEVKEENVQRAFPALKKVKVPSLERVDNRDLTYIGWNDYGSRQKFLMFRTEEGWIGIKGSFRKSQRNGICSICHSQERVGLFMADIKTAGESELKRGHYICQDSVACNQNIQRLEPLNNFIEAMTSDD